MYIAKLVICTFMRCGVREARKAYGITRGVSQRFFKLLNLPPAQIEALLDGVY